QTHTSPLLPYTTLFRSQNEKETAMSDRKRRSLAWLAVFVALGISVGCELRANRSSPASGQAAQTSPSPPSVMATSQSEYLWDIEDRKSTRLNSSHQII